MDQVISKDSFQPRVGISFPGILTLGRPLEAWLLQLCHLVVSCRYCATNQTPDGTSLINAAEERS